MHQIDHSVLQRLRPAVGEFCNSHGHFAGAKQKGPGPSGAPGKVQTGAVERYALRTWLRSRGLRTLSTCSKDKTGHAYKQLATALGKEFR